MDPLYLCIDAGHGGHDPGVIGPTGLRECDLNLDIAGRVAAKAVADGWRVLVTRAADRFVPLSKRAGISNEAHAHLFISIHGNGAENRKAHGVELWTTVGQTKADEVIPYLERAWRDEFPDVEFRVDRTDGDADKEKDYAVLRLTKAPAILYEVGFVSNPEEEALLKTAEYRARIASAIVAGINAWRESLKGKV